MQRAFGSRICYETEIISDIKDSMLIDDGKNENNVGEGGGVRCMDR